MREGQQSCLAYAYASCDSLTRSDLCRGPQEYQAALQNEDYAKAAALRDEGAVGLAGWWVAEDKDDPHGHLLHITPGFGRYIGYAYTPTELAQAAVSHLALLDAAHKLTMVPQTATKQNMLGPCKVNNRQ